MSEFKYPMWFESKIDKAIVKFTSLNSGKIVKKGNGTFNVGRKSDCFFSHSSEHHWTNVTEQYAPPRCHHEISFDDECVECDKLNKLYNRPKVSHYQDGGGIEPIDYINSHNFNFNIGNCIKYCSRAGLKGDAIEDLQKAIHYLQFEIERLENVQK